MVGWVCEYVCQCMYGSVRGGVSGCVVCGVGCTVVRGAWGGFERCCGGRCGFALVFVCV